MSHVVGTIRCVGSSSDSLDSRINRSSTEPKYLDGATKLTYVSGFDGDYVKLEDLLQKDHLKDAFLCALAVDLDWLLTKLPENILIVIAKHWDSRQEAEGVYILPDTNILLVHPPLPNAPIGCFHAKLMLLFFDGWMRVVVASGNLIPYDWETNENVIFVQDFPIVQATGSNNGNLHPFAQDIKDFILAIGLKNHIVNKLSQYDFSRAKAKLVASIPGAYKGVENIKKYGHGRLCKVVQEVCGQNENIILECQTSTLGGLTADFLHEFYRSASGIDPLEISKPRTKKSQGVERPLPQMTMVYPSNRTVSSSKYSKAAGAALFFGKSNYEKHTFPKEIIRNCLSKRDGILIHSKFVLARYTQQEQPKNSQKRQKTNKLNSDDIRGSSDDKAEFTRKSYVSKETEIESQPTISDQDIDPIRGWYYCGYVYAVLYMRQLGQDCDKIGTKLRFKKMVITQDLKLKIGILMGRDYVLERDKSKKAWDRQSVEHCVYTYLLSKEMKQMHSLTCIYSTLQKPQFYEFRLGENIHFS
ncbi:phospholipase D/nuclease [Gigaspora margarita]|uniref:Phospholipase D/nuclease n=1 Tax=Gigaspora margarita TaxID=4874 RepID=A0A8H4A8E0_GIGMA|nr:phospholipase D/nuclease [Gigaspora margarita]